MNFEYSEKSIAFQEKLKLFIATAFNTCTGGSGNFP